MLKRAVGIAGEYGRTLGIPTFTMDIDSANHIDQILEADGVSTFVVRSAIEGEPLKGSRPLRTDANVGRMRTPGHYHILLAGERDWSGPLFMRERN